MAPWEDWGVCRQDGQKFRKRDITELAEIGGKACHGDMIELYPCDPEDCELSDWSPWDVCAVTCGGGQQQRYRQVNRPSRNGGLPCPSPTALKEIRSCGQGPCSWKDCTVAEWSAWAPCSATCGEGQQMRERAVNQTRRMDGFGCFFPLTETRQCPTQSACPAADCAWDSWSPWSTCTRTCGGGEQLRNRIIKVMPEPGGRPCEPLPKEELQPCNLWSCEAAGCVDGEWGSWSDWGHCSASCEGGVSWRWRHISKQANSCGVPSAGPDREYQSCNENVTCHDEDCEFGAWEDWSGCTAVCNGIKRRSRYIEVFGFGAGSYCNGALKETAPCSSSLSEAECEMNARQDCEFSEWVEGPCSTTCGGGHVERTRHITVEPVGGGMACYGALKEDQPCGTQACPDAEPLCHWGDWSDWGACDKCGGERKRNRHIQQPPAGGQVCDPGASEELDACPRTCDDSTEGMACAWATWEPWSTCSATCGSGRRQRRRNLELHAGGLLPDAITRLADQQQQLQDWELETQRLEQKRFQDLALASVVGGCAVAAAALATVLLRARSTTRICWRSYVDAHEDAGSRDDRLSLLAGTDTSH